MATNENVLQGLPAATGGAGVVRGDGVTPNPRRFEQTGRDNFTFGGLIDSLDNPMQLAIGLGLGFAEGAILDPLEGLASLPIINLTQADEFMTRAKTNLYSFYEENALAAGMTAPEIGAAYATGDFFGMFAPVGGAIGLSRMTLHGTKILTAADKAQDASQMAQAAGAARQFGVGTVKRHLFEGDLITETVAGIYYGALFTPAENMNERFGNIMRESANFGLGRLAVNTLVRPMVGYKLRRASEIGLADRVAGLSAKVEAGGGQTFLDDLDNIDDFIKKELMLQGEEHYILASALAQDLLPEGDDIRTLLTAVGDMHISKGQTRGAIRMSYDARTSTKIMDEQVERLNATGRGVFERVERRIAKKSGGDEVISELHWGPEKLNLKQRAEIESMGFFSGQTVYHNTANFTFAGSKVATRNMPTKGIKRGELIAELADVNGKIRQVNPKKVQGALGGYSVRQNRSRAIKDTAARFGKHADEAEDAILKQQRSMKDGDVAQAAASTGKINPQASSSARRNVKGGGAIINPEDIGRVNDLDPATIAQMDKMNSELGRLNEEATQIKGMLDGSVKPQAGDPAGQVGTQELTEALFKAQQEAQEIQGALQQLNTGSADWIVQNIRENGIQNSGVLESVDVFDYASQVEAWAMREGINTKAPDWPAIKGAIVDERVQQVWERASPADKDLISALVEKQMDLIDEFDVGVDALANSKGYQVFHDVLGMTEDGLARERWVASDIYTGKTVNFTNEEAAREFFESMVREQADMMGDAAFPNLGLGDYGGGLEIDEANGFFGRMRGKEAFGFDMKRPMGKSTGRMLQQAERKTGIPFFTQIFEPLDRAIQRVAQEYDRLGPAVDDVFTIGHEPKTVGNTLKLKSGKAITMPREQRLEIGRFFDAYGKGKSIRQLRAGDEIAAAEAFFQGPNAAQQIESVRKMRNFFDEMAAMEGIDSQNYMAYYYGTMRGAFRANRGHLRRTDLEFGMADAGHDAVEVWADQIRKGDTSGQEYDPYLTMQKYTRSMLMRKDFNIDPLLARQGFNGSVDGLYQRSMALTKRTVGSLNEAERARFVAIGADLANPNQRIMGDGLGGFMESFLNGLRGGYNGEFDATVDMLENMFQNVGLDISPDVVNKLVRNLTTSAYGASMGLRGAQISRNLTQNLWMGWTQLGTQDMAIAIREVMDPKMGMEWYKRAQAGGVLRERSAGIQAKDDFVEMLLDNDITVDGSPQGRSVEEWLRKLVGAGEISASLAEKTLVPFTDADAINRTIAFVHNIKHTERWLDRWNKGDLAELAAKAGTSEREVFMQEALKYKPWATRERFMELLDLGLERDALDYIGKVGSDQWNFVYMQGGMPQWMQKGYGRMFGMFASYPISMVDWAATSMQNSTPKQRMELGMRAAALTGIIANMSIQSGVNMKSYFAYAPVWSGGPIVDLAIDAREVLDAPMDRKVNAFNRFVGSGARFFMPGQGLITDMWGLRDIQSPADAALRMLLQRPAADSNGFRINFQTDIFTGANVAQISQDRLLPTGADRVPFAGNRTSTEAIVGTRRDQALRAQQSAQGIQRF